MEISIATQEVEREGIARSKRMSLDGDDPVIWQFFSDTLYSNKLRWVLEYAQNARDADPNWKLVLPSAVKPYMEFIDNGASMSREFMLNDFCIAGRSTKREDNLQSGGFGIGRLSGPQGTIFECRNPDKIRTWSLVKDERNIPMVVLLSEVPRPSDVVVGTTVRVPIEPGKLNHIIAETKRMLMFFGLPNFPKLEPALSGDGWNLYQPVSYGANVPLRNEVYVLVGGYTFQVDSGHMQDLRSRKDSTYDGITVLMGADCPVVLELPIGSVDIALNRESLKYTDRTDKTLAAAASKALADILETFQKQLDGCSTRWEALKLAGSMSGAIGAIVRYDANGYWRSKASRQFFFKGKEIHPSAATVSYSNVADGGAITDTTVYAYDMASRKRRRRNSNNANDPTRVPLAKEEKVYLRPANEDKIKIFLATGQEDRVQARLLTEVKNDTFVVLIKSPTGDWTSALEELGNPPQTIITNLADITPPAIQRSTATKTRTKARMFVLDHDELAFTDQTLLLQPDSVYVRMNLGKVQEPSNWVDEMRKHRQYVSDPAGKRYLRSLIQQLPHNLLIGIPASYKSKLDPTWMELSDWLVKNQLAKFRNLARRIMVRELFGQNDTSVIDLAKSAGDTDIPALWQEVYDASILAKADTRWSDVDDELVPLLRRDPIAKAVGTVEMPTYLDGFAAKIAKLKAKYPMIDLAESHMHMRDLSATQQKILFRAIVKSPAA